jgi:hypothetical protein
LLGGTHRHIGPSSVLLQPSQHVRDHVVTRRPIYPLLELLTVTGKL